MRTALFATLCAALFLATPALAAGTTYYAGTVQSFGRVPITGAFCGSAAAVQVNVDWVADGARFTAAGECGAGQTTFPPGSCSQDSFGVLGCSFGGKSATLTPAGRMTLTLGNEYLEGDLTPLV